MLVLWRSVAVTCRRLYLISIRRSLLYGCIHAFVPLR
jgi:hypothetical protein